LILAGAAALVIVVTGGVGAAGDRALWRHARWLIAAAWLLGAVLVVGAWLFHRDVRSAKGR
jgi:hypothetical protein